MSIVEKKILPNVLAHNLTGVSQATAIPRLHNSIFLS